MATPNPERLAQLLADMVDIYSPSGKESQLVSFLADYLTSHGLPVVLRPVTEGRMNIEVVYDSDPEVAFLGHVDTVPAFDIEEYESRVEGDVMYGLGTADMKGGCAAMIEAFVTAHEHGVAPPCAALYLVVGEEENGDGTEALLESVRFPWAIVAEPTGLVPCLEHFGYIEMLIQTSGHRRHAAMAGRESNAILTLLDTLGSLAQTVETDHPDAVYNIRSVHSSESGFAVPGSCEAWLDFHLPPELSAASFAEKMTRIARQGFQDNTLLDSLIEFPLQTEGYSLPPTGMLVHAMQTAFAAQGRPWTTGSFRSHSDANLLREAGCAPIMLGPGNLARAHTREECVKPEHVATAADMYLGILEHLVS